MIDEDLIFSSPRVVGRQDSWRGTPLEPVPEVSETAAETQTLEDSIAAAIKEVKDEVFEVEKEPGSAPVGEAEPTEAPVESSAAATAVAVVEKTAAPVEPAPVAVTEGREAQEKAVGEENTSVECHQEGSPAAGSAAAAAAAIAAAVPAPAPPAPEPQLQEKAVDSPRSSMIGQPARSSLFSADATPRSPLPPGAAAARMELEDAIKRIEAHVKIEQAARRAAEDALAQALQRSASLSEPHSTAAPMLPGLPLTQAEGLRSELHRALTELAHTQNAVHAASALVTRVLGQLALHQAASGAGQQQQQTPAAPSVAASPRIKAVQEEKTPLPSGQFLPLADAADNVANREGVSWDSRRQKLSLQRLPHAASLPAVRTKMPSAPSSPSAITRRASYKSSLGRGREGEGLQQTPSGAAAAAAKGAFDTTPDRFATRKSDAFISTYRAAQWEKDRK